MRQTHPNDDFNRKVLEFQEQLNEHFDGVWAFGFDRETGNPFVTGGFKKGAHSDIMQMFLNPLMEWLEKQKGENNE